MTLDRTRVLLCVIALVGMEIAIASALRESPTRLFGGPPTRLTAPMPEWVWLIGFCGVFAALLALGRMIFADSFRRRKKADDDYFVEVQEPPRTRPFVLLLAALSCCAAVIVAVLLLWYFHAFEPSPGGESNVTSVQGPAAPAILQAGSLMASDSWPPSAYTAILIFSIALVFALGYVAFLYWESRRGVLGPFSSLPLRAGNVSKILSANLSDLESIPDPRQAILRCYGRFERLLAESHFPRLPAYTASEFMRSILRNLHIPTAPIDTLTRLFELSRFSIRPIGVSERGEALQAIREIRDWLQEHGNAQQR